MKKLKYILSCVGIMMFAACGDDSSSATGGEKYILDEANQRAALIYDRCYVSENTTRWDEYVDTTWFRYKFIGDTLIVDQDGNTADGYVNYGEVREIRDGYVLVGGREGNIFGTWKSTKADCFYEEGKIYCNGYEADGYGDAFFTVNVSKSNLTVSWELKKNSCPAEDIEFELEEVLLYGLDESEYSINRLDCSTVKFNVYGKSVTATISEDIGRDNVATKEITYTSGSKTCRYVSKKVHKLLQMPASLCNANDMRKYMKKNADYPHKYQADNDNEFYPCMADLLGVKVEY